MSKNAQEVVRDHSIIFDNTVEPFLTIQALKDDARKISKALTAFSDLYCNDTLNRDITGEQDDTIRGTTRVLRELRSAKIVAMVDIIIAAFNKGKLGPVDVYALMQDR